MARVIVTRVDEDYAFEAVDAIGQKMRMDIPAEQGGHDSGLRPMQTLLTALGGCSAVDVVMILKKQKETLTHLEIVIDGEREVGKEPALWKEIHMIFKLKGSMSQERAEKACALSLEKYCSVAATLRAAGATITWSVEL
jgi:putative redox protein